MFSTLERAFGKLKTPKPGIDKLKAVRLADWPAREVVATMNNSSLDDEISALERVGVAAVTLSYSGCLGWLIEHCRPANSEMYVAC